MRTGAAQLTAETVELLQALIQQQCVNDGSPTSGNESRSAALLLGFIEGCGADVEVFETAPGRTSLIARHHGTDPDAPALCLMGHTDVVPVSPDGWLEDPFGGDLIRSAAGVDEVWGRGAVDMLNLTSSMAVAFREIVRTGQRYPGDIVYFAVADEEAGGVYGAMPLIENEWDALRCDFVLTEYGGMPNRDQSAVLLTTGEKTGAFRKLVIRGTPGHGSMPYASDNALIRAAEIVRRIAEHSPMPRLDELFAQRLDALGLDEATKKRLLDPSQVADALAELPSELARNLHSCSHVTVSPNQLRVGDKANTIPDRAVLVLDIRMLPGDTQAGIDADLRHLIGEDLLPSVEIQRLFPNNPDAAPHSSTDTALWRALGEAVQVAYPGATLTPSIVTGGTDARFFRKRGVPAYGAGLLSPHLPLPEFLNRFHGHNERIDTDSLALTTQLWLDVCDRLWV